MEKKLVSIIIPTYNCARYIIQAIESCIRQTYKNIEIIVIDDGSTDNTREIINKYIVNNNIIYIYQKNQERSIARNEGIKSSKGEFIQFLDADDLLVETKILKDVEYLEKNKQYFGVYCSTIYFKNDNVNDIITASLIKCGKNTYKKLIKGNFIPINSMLTRRSNVFFDKDLKTMEDWDYWLNIILHGKMIGYIKESLCYVRVHQNNTSHNKKLMLENEKNVLCKMLKYNLCNDLINFRLFIICDVLNNRQKLYYLKNSIRINKMSIAKYIIYKIKNKIKNVFNIKKDHYNLLEE